MKTSKIQTNIFGEEANISTIKHHVYKQLHDDWEKYRLTYIGGDAFKDEYLKKLSKSETETDFNIRYDLTYVPAFAKAAIIEVKNSIFNRLTDVRRINGPDSYQRVINGENKGVDGDSMSMNAFVGSKILPELLVMSKVGVFVDSKMTTTPTGTRIDDKNALTYLTIYTVEQIRSWSPGDKLYSLLLEADIDEVDDEFGLVNGSRKQYRHYRLTTEGVEETIYDSTGDKATAETRLVRGLTAIPFVMIEIPSSLIADVADYQIALMNMASNNVMYDIKANFPFYIEQSDPYSERTFMRQASAQNIDTPDNQNYNGTASQAGVAADKNIEVGATKGRRYSKGTDAPSFIHPSPEPLEVSMKKQDEMKREIRQLILLAVTNMDPRRESADSKKLDERGLESGLSYIAQVLERAERAIADVWRMYDSTGEPATIKYPEDFTMRTVSERTSEAEGLIRLSKSSASKTYQKEIAKQVATITLGTRVSTETLSTIHAEIDRASVLYVEPDILQSDVESGLVTTKTASEIRGYPAGESEQAKKEHAERAARIVAAQTKAAAVNKAAARGVPDLDPDKDTSPVEEKQSSQSRDIDPDGVKGVRG